MGINTNLKHKHNHHNTELFCIVYDQATEWLTEKYGLVSKGNRLVLLKRNSSPANKLVLQQYLVS